MCKREDLKCSLPVDVVESVRKAARLCGLSVDAFMTALLQEASVRDVGLGVTEATEKPVRLDQNGRLQVVLRGGVCRNVRAAAKRCRMNTSAFLRRLIVESDVASIKTWAYVYGAVSKRAQLFCREGDGEGRVLQFGCEWEMPNELPEAQT